MDRSFHGQMDVPTQYVQLLHVAEYNDIHACNSRGEENTEIEKSSQKPVGRNGGINI